MEQIEKERFFTMAETYDKMAQKLVPNYNFLQDEVFNIIDFNKNDELIIVDLGAGSGIFIEKFLNKYPNSKAYWIDYSEDFLVVAQNKLSKYGERVNYIISDLENNWENKIKGIPNIIFSMSAIHHLEDDAKMQLFQKCYRLLNNNGWFLNVDETRTFYDDSYLQSLKFWVHYVDNYVEDIEEGELDYYQKWKFQFDNWEKRNIDNINEPKMKGDDLHANFMDQVKWLNDTGFKYADVFVKYHLWALIGGKK